MIDDIFRAEFHFEDPSGASSCSAYYQQIADNGATDYDTYKLAEALETNLAPAIVGYLSNDFWFTGVRVRKVYDEPQNAYLETGNPQLGTVTGPGLPSNNCLLMRLNQGTFPLKSNGRMFFPGLPEPQTNVGVLDVTYANTQCQALAVALIATQNAVGDTGQWKIGVISQKVLNLVPPTKDWAGAFAFCTSVGFNPVIAIQRRRTTRVIGAIG